MNEATGPDVPPGDIGEPRREHPSRALVQLRWLVGALCLASFVATLPLLAPVFLSAWAAIIAWPLQLWLVRHLRHRSIAAAVLSVVLVVAFLLPLLISVLSLSGAAMQLGRQLAQSKSGVEALKSLSAGGPGSGFDLHHLDWHQVLAMAQEHGASALNAARAFFGAVSLVVIQVVVFVAGFYTLLVDGDHVYEWLLERLPLRRGQKQRLGNTFAEVGRGLLVGTGLTALLQGTLAGIGYLVVGVPQALVLGLVTVFAALIPSVGSGLVWVPVTAGLAISNRPGAAVAMLAVGVVVSVSDNVVRPLLARYAELRLNGLVLFVAMLGGIIIFGGWGLLIGPLVVRLAVEGLTMLKEENAAHPDSRTEPG